MASKPALSGGALLAALLLTAACQPQTQRSAVGQNYGQDQEKYLRDVELQRFRSGANPGTQNPPVTAVNPGTTGIVRQPGVGAPTR